MFGRLISKRLALASALESLILFPVSSRFSARVGWGGADPLYKPYRYVPPQRVWFLGLSGLKTGIHFVHFVLESVMVFEGTTGAYERNYPFNSKGIRTK